MCEIKPCFVQGGAPEPKICAQVNKYPVKSVREYLCCESGAFAVLGSYEDNVCLTGVELVRFAEDQIQLSAQMRVSAPYRVSRCTPDW